MLEKERGERMNQTGIDRKQYARLLGIFVRATRRDIETLRSAVADGDAAAMVSTAHHIKGAAEGLELGEIAHNARFIEEHVGRPDRFDESLKLCDEMDRQLTSISRQFGIIEG